jgi:predicted RNase H-like nuclease (RuvC/YqgF family)
MDDEELAEFFAAKKENEELKAKISKLETEMNSIVAESDIIVAESAIAKNHIFALDDKLLGKANEIERLNGHINGMRLASTSLREGYDRMLSFIKLLDDYPMFWGGSYKRSIMQFLHDRFPEK